MCLYTYTYKYSAETCALRRAHLSKLGVLRDAGSHGRRSWGDGFQSHPDDNG